MMFALTELYDNRWRIKVSEPTFTTPRFDRVTPRVPTPHNAMQLRGMHMRYSNLESNEAEVRTPIPAEAFDHLF